MSRQWFQRTGAALGLAALSSVPSYVHQHAGEQAFFDAVKAGDATRVEALIDVDPALVGAVDETGRTPLHWAARGPSIPVLALLVGKGAKVDARDRGGNAAIHSLASRGNTEGLTLLLDHGASIDLASADGETALHLAAQAGQVEALRLLIGRKADIERANAYGRTPLVLAAREMGGVAVIRALLEAGANVDAADKAGDTALTLAAWRGSGDVVDLLLAHKAHLPAGVPQTVALLDNAVSKGLATLFRRMVGPDTDLDRDLGHGRTFAHRAAAGGSVPILEALVARGLALTGVDAYGWTPLHFASDKGRQGAIVWLLDRGASLDARTTMGQTAFNIAEENSDDETMALLRSKGAETSAPRFPDLRGPYLGQKPPGRIPEIFASGIVSAAYGMHSNVVFAPDGTEAFWSLMIPPRGVGYSTDRTLVTRLVDGRWTYPRPAVFGGVPLGDVPFFHPDGTRLYDMSDRPLPAGQPSGGEHIWVWEKGGPDGWCNPRPIDATVNTLPQHWQFAVDRAATLYFNSNWNGARGIFRAPFVGGRYGQPVCLDARINAEGAAGSFPFVAPDGRYLLFTRGRDEIVVSFADGTGGWRDPVSLGSEYRGLLPVVSPDGKYLFISRNQRAYWADAAVIAELEKRTRTVRPPGPLGVGMRSRHRSPSRPL